MRRWETKQTMDNVSLFNLFIRRAEELEATRFWQSIPTADWGITMGLPVGTGIVSISAEHNAPDRELPTSVVARFALPRQEQIANVFGSFYAVKFPDQDDLRSFLVIFRKFVAQKELLHLGGIYNRIDLAVPDGFTKEAFRASRKRWSICRKDGRSDFRVSGLNSNPEYAAVNLWMQGHVFHDVPEKMDELGLDKYDESVRKAIIFNCVKFAVNVTREIVLMRKLLKRVLRLKLDMSKS